MCCALAAILLSLLAGPQAVCRTMRRRSARIRAAAAVLVLLLAAGGGTALAAQYLAARDDGGKPWSSLCFGSGTRAPNSRP